jgi:hypothetical protein
VLYTIIKIIPAKGCAGDEKVRNYPRKCEKSPVKELDIQTARKNANWLGGFAHPVCILAVKRERLLRVRKAAGCAINETGGSLAGMAIEPLPCAPCPIE